MNAWRARSSGDSRPRSVAAVVRKVHTSLRLTRALECVLFFVAGALLTRSAALLSGVPSGSHAASFGLGFLCGGLCAAAWWLEHSRELGSTARALDRRLRHHGALTTAFELENRAGGALSSMEELVCWRVLERLRTREALSALFPPLFLPIAAPALAALALVWVVDARRAPRSQALDFRALAAGLERALSFASLDEERAGLAGGDGQGGLSRAQVQELNAVLQARTALPYSAEDWVRTPAETRQTLEAIDRRTAELAARVAPESELHARLEEARNWLDALRMGLAEVPAVAAGAGTEGSAAGSLTSAPSDGTISRPMAAFEPSAMRVQPPVQPAFGVAPPAAVLGRQDGTWWPAEYDDIVAYWIESSRAQALDR